MNDIKKLIHEFILTTYLPGESSENLRYDTPLLTSGILDSLAALGLASFLEEQFNIRLSVYDLGVEQFNRICDIESVVVRSQAQQRGLAPGKDA
jgi:acyl carrier protein